MMISPRLAVEPATIHKHMCGCRFLVLITLLFGSQIALAGDLYQTKNVILITLDGVRVQEVFSGLDETIAAHDEQQIYSDIAQQRLRYSGATPAGRREALLPVFWGRLAPQGVVLGNAAYGNHVKVQNKVLWSTPGYTEIMTGGPRPEIIDNDFARHGHRTAMELAQEKLGLDRSQVVQFGSWERFWPLSGRTRPMWVN